MTDQATPIIGVQYWAVHRLMGEPPTVLHVICDGIRGDGSVELSGVNTGNPIAGAVRLYGNVGTALHQCHMELAKDLINLSETMLKYAEEARQLAHTYDTLIVAEPPGIVTAQGLPAPAMKQ